MGACAHIRSISSEEFRSFLENSKLSKKDKGAQKLLNLESLQLSMIKCGPKCIPQLPRLKATQISDIFNSRKNALDALSSMLDSATSFPDLDDKKCRIFEDDYSFTYLGSKYCLPERYFLAVKHIAEQRKRSNLTLQISNILIIFLNIEN